MGADGNERVTRELGAVARQQAGLGDDDEKEAPDGVGHAVGRDVEDSKHGVAGGSLLA